MQNSDIQPGSLWIYTGIGSGRGLTHKVLEPVDKDIVTWTVVPLPMNDSIAGYSWLGSKQQFLQNFKPLN